MNAIDSIFVEQVKHDQTTVKKHLSELKTHQAGVIAALHADQELYYRLVALGFRVGQKIEMMRRAIFNGPIHVRVGTTEVMLRKNEAEKIEIYC